MARHPGTFSHCVFSIHYGHDLLIADNVAAVRRTRRQNLAVPGSHR